MARQSINLIPRQEIVEQKKKTAIKASSILAVLLLIIASGVAGYFFYQTQTLKSQIKSADTSIEQYRTDINALSDIEVSARTLDSRYKAVQGLFDSRTKYSVLLTELQKRVPSNVAISSFSLSGDGNSAISLTGRGQNYLAIAQFLSTLSDAEFSDASDDLKPLFTDVSLNSVTLDSQNLTVSYFIVVRFNPELLR